MTVADFSPLHGLVGGALVGLAAATLLLFNGRVAGVSGIFGQLIVGREVPWRAMWIAGLLAGGLGSLLVAPDTFGAPVQGSLGLIVVAGFLVGLGTRIGSGCTSGHGICGLARLSLRSVVATVSFIAAGVVTVAAARSVGGLS